MPLPSSPSSIRRKSQASLCRRACRRRGPSSLSPFRVTRLSNTAQPSAAIRVGIGGDVLLLSPLGNMRVALNGTPLVTPARVGFFDQLRIDEHEVDLRELAAAIEGRSRVESFSLEDVEYSF